jgi:hypothetical protein
VASYPHCLRSCIFWSCIFSAPARCKCKMKSGLYLTRPGWRARTSTATARNAKGCKSGVRLPAARWRSGDVCPIPHVDAMAAGQRVPPPWLRPRHSAPCQPRGTSRGACTRKVQDRVATFASVSCDHQAIQTLYKFVTRRPFGSTHIHSFIHYMSTVSIQNWQQDDKNCPMPLSRSTYIAIIKQKT